ncbi:MAG: type II secretion system protein [Chloroflexaceae bacterium]|nr:type II secretion system protein [Chloroflexaceae bacterium]
MLQQYRSFVVFRQRLLSQLPPARPGNPQGFTLLELLVVLAIAGILSVMAFPLMVGAANKARYGEVTIQLDAIATEINSLYMERGSFPGDVFPNQRPAGVNYFPLQGSNNIPFDSKYDYESWTVGSSQCYIQVTFFGKNGSREPGSMMNRAAYPQPGLYEFGDDRILSLGIFNIPCRPSNT